MDGWDDGTSRDGGKVAVNLEFHCSPFCFYPCWTLESLFYSTKVNHDSHFTVICWALSFTVRVVMS